MPSIALATTITDVTCCDISCNGYDDIIYSSAGGIRYLTASTMPPGGLAFSFSATSTLMSTAPSRRVCCADINCDLLPDVVAATTTGLISLFKTATPGVFMQVPLTTNATGLGPLVCCDLDGDSDIDIATLGSGFLLDVLVSKAISHPYPSGMPAPANDFVLATSVDGGATFGVLAGTTPPATDPTFDTTAVPPGNTLVASAYSPTGNVNGTVVYLADIGVEPAQVPSTPLGADPITQSGASCAFIWRYASDVGTCVFDDALTVTGIPTPAPSLVNAYTVPPAGVSGISILVTAIRIYPTPVYTTDTVKFDLL